MNNTLQISTVTVTVMWWMTEFFGYGISCILLWIEIQTSYVATLHPCDAQM